MIEKDKTAYKERKYNSKKLELYDNGYYLRYISLMNGMFIMSGASSK